MIRLVSLTILPDEAVDILGNIICVPRNGEQAGPTVFQNQPCSCKDQSALPYPEAQRKSLPAIRLPIHIFIVWILRIEIFDPIAISQTSPHQSGGGIKQVGVIMRPLHQHVVIGFVVKLFRQQCHRVIIVGIFQRLGHARLCFRFHPWIFNIWRGDVTLFHVFRDIRSGSAFHRGISQEQMVGAFDVIASQSTQIRAGNEIRRVVADKKMSA